jgi:hypothetical protein
MYVQLKGEGMAKTDGYILKQYCAIGKDSEVWLYLTNDSRARNFYAWHITVISNQIKEGHSMITHEEVLARLLYYKSLGVLVPDYAIKEIQEEIGNSYCIGMKA